jgi:hypothetical protein
MGGASRGVSLGASPTLSKRDSMEIRIGKNIDLNKCYEKKEPWAWETHCPVCPVAYSYATLQITDKNGKIARLFSEMFGEKVKPIVLMIYVCDNCGEMIVFWDRKK